MTRTESPLVDIDLPADELSKLLDALDAARVPNAGPADRADRKSYRSSHVVFGVLNEQAKPDLLFQVPTRNISRRGIGFLHRQMLTPGQKLQIHLPMPNGRAMRLEARVIHCRHLQGMIHEVGAEFLKLLEAAPITDPDEPPPAADA